MKGRSIYKEHRRIAQMLADGKTPKQIAFALGFSVKSICAYTRDTGLRRPKPRTAGCEPKRESIVAMVHEGLKIAAIAKRLDLSVSSLKTWLSVNQIRVCRWRGRTIGLRLNYDTLEVFARKAGHRPVEYYLADLLTQMAAQEGPPP